MPKKDISRRAFLRQAAAVSGAAAIAGCASQSPEKTSKPLQVRYGLNLLVYTAAFTKNDVGLIAKAADMGYEGVEILLGDFSGPDLQAIRQACQKAGVGLTTCCILPLDANITGEDAAVREAGVAHLKKMVDLTAEMGGGVMAGPLYAPVRHLTGRPPTDDEWKWCVEGLRAAADHAQKASVTLAIEPLNRFETYMVTTSADAIRLIEAVGSPNVVLHMDTFHANIEEKDTAAAIRAAGARLGHFHASESDRGIPGTGQVRWKEVFAALKAIGYDRWVTVESFATGIVDLCAAACIWRPIYGSADELATKGLEFLKETARSA